MLPGGCGVYHNNYPLPKYLFCTLNPTCLANKHAGQSTCIISVWKYCAGRDFVVAPLSHHPLYQYNSTTITCATMTNTIAVVTRRNITAPGNSSSCKNNFHPWWLYILSPRRWLLVHRFMRIRIYHAPCQLPSIPIPGCPPSQFQM